MSIPLSVMDAAVVLVCAPAHLELDLYELELQYQQLEVLCSRDMTRGGMPMRAQRT